MIEPLLPTKVRGVRRADDRRMLNGIFWWLRTGAPWADHPARYDSHGSLTQRRDDQDHALVDADGLPIALKLAAPWHPATTSDDNFLVSAQLAGVRIWLRHNESAA